MSNKVSILIPLYNNETYIAETIQSVINQTYKNIEIVIVDDGSTDKSYKIAKCFRSQYVKLYKQENKGACAARNFAFKKCTGDYIQYLDADDLLSPDKLEEQIKLFKQFGENILTSCKWGRFKESIEKVKWEGQHIDKDYDNPLMWLIDSWMGKGMAQTAVWLTPRKIIEKAGPWDETLNINQDGEFFCRVLLQAQAIKFSESGGVFYRSGLPGSISQAKRLSMEKAKSLLRSYKNYELVLSLQDNQIIKKAIGNNYLNFIYLFYGLYPDLTDVAEKSFYDLGFVRKWPVGGKYFRQLARIIGFNRTLKLKTAIKKNIQLF